MFSIPQLLYLYNSRFSHFSIYVKSYWHSHCTIKKLIVVRKMKTSRNHLSNTEHFVCATISSTATNCSLWLWWIYVLTFSELFQILYISVRTFNYFSDFSEKFTISQWISKLSFIQSWAYIFNSSTYVDVAVTICNQFNMEQCNSISNVF